MNNYLQHMKDTDLETVEVKTNNGKYTLKYTESNMFYANHKGFKVVGYIHTNSKNTISDSKLSSLTDKDFEIPITSNTKGVLLGYICVGDSNEVIGIVRSSRMPLLLLTPFIVILGTILIGQFIINESRENEEALRNLIESSETDYLSEEVSHEGSYKVMTYDNIIVSKDNPIIELDNPKTNDVLFTYTVINRDLEVLVMTDYVKPGEPFKWDVSDLLTEGETINVMFYIDVVNEYDLAHRQHPVYLDVSITMK